MSTFITSPHHQLRFGSLDLLGENVRNGVGFTLETQGNDMTWGNPKPVVESIEQYIAQGLLARVGKWEDREAFLTITITGTDESLAAAEAALEAECNRPNELSWRPPGEFAQTTVFDVRYASIEHVMNDLDELRRERTFGIRFINRAHAKSDTNVITDIPAPSTAGTATTVDDVSSASGWTLLDPNADVVAIAAAIRFTLPGERGNPNFTAIKSYPNAWAEGEYLRVAWTGSNATVTAKAGPDGKTPLEQVAQDGRTRWFARPEGLTSIGKLSLYAFRTQEKRQTRVFLHSVAFTDVTYIPKTGRTSQRSISVQGSAPTEASLDIGSNVALGDVVAYTYPDLGEYGPRLRRYDTAGTIEADSSTVAGSWLNLTVTNGATFSIPSSALPAGTYHVLARLRGNSAGRTPLTWTMKVGDAEQKGVTYPVLAVTPRIVALDAITTPAQTTADSDAVITLKLEAGARLDEVWLLHPRGELTWVRAGDGTSVRIVSPSLDHPRPAVYVDGVGADVQAAGRHEWPAEEINVDLTTEAVGAWTSLDYTPRWHTHAGRLES